MPVRRPRGSQAKKLQKLSRVVQVQDKNHFDRIIQKAVNRIIVVHFISQPPQPYNTMRALITDLSKKQEYQKVVFAEVDIDKLEDVAEATEVTQAPACLFYLDGKVIDRVNTYDPYKVYALLQKNSKKVADTEDIKEPSKLQQLFSNKQVMIPTLSVLGVAVVGLLAFISTGQAELSDKYKKKQKKRMRRRYYD